MKKILALVLTLLILMSTFTVGVNAVQIKNTSLSYSATDEMCISLKDAVKAYEEEKNVEVETYRNYFYIPDNDDGFFEGDAPSWYNEYSQNICIWYDSTMAENSPIPESYCGYKLESLIENVYYADIPVGVIQFSINNGVEAESSPEYSACSTPVLGLEAADKNGQFPNHDGEIYVIKEFDSAASSSTAIFSGKWYQYKGMDCYGNGKDRICLNPTHDHKSVKEAIAQYEEQTGEDAETNRYYFLMPNGANGEKGDDDSIDENGEHVSPYGEYAPTWYNEYTNGAGIFWWGSGVADPEMWPGYTMEQSNVSDVYYADVPKAVTTIIFNNNVNGGVAYDSSVYWSAHQSINVPCEYYAPGESPNYPDGTESFDNMIYVIYPIQITTGELTLKRTWGGEWYYYYGSGCYGTVKDGDDHNCIRDDHDHRPFNEQLKDYEEQTGEKVETNRYYFLMPNGTNSEVCDDELYKNYGELPQSWYNENADTAGIYWWDTGILTPKKWPGYEMSKGDAESVFYVDLPTSVETAIFNNHFDPGMIDWTDPVYFDNAKTINVYMLGYEKGESSTYPEGLDSFDNMIYVLKYDCDYELEPNNIWAGEWYYYYGNGCYGTVKDGDKADCIRQDHNHIQLSVKEAIAQYEAETGEKVETNRYYFLMPNGTNGEKGDDDSADENGEYVQPYGEYAPTWYNEYTNGAGIFWWGSDVADPEMWPGYTMEQSNVSDVYYADVPKAVTTIIFNNYVNGGVAHDTSVYRSAHQSINVPCEYYDPGESPNYPDGTESFDNMIFVIDPDIISINALVYKQCWAGEWYYYYGDGCYGTVKDGSIDNCIRDDHHDKNGNHLVSYISGDVDGDKVVSIMDATFIQMVLAELKAFNDGAKALADYDNDGEVSVLDATAIQMKLAELS